LIAASIFSFPGLVLFLHNFKLGWKRWYQTWRNRTIRFGGWITIRRWTLQFRNSDFTRKLQKAKGRLSVNAKRA